MMRMSGEDDLIARYFKPLAGKAGLALADDAACLTPPAGQDLVLTKDMLVAGVHFFADDAPASIARKALRVNLSDLAAKGAAPLGFLLGLGLPAALMRDAGWLSAFAAALGEDSADYACPLLGGDTVLSPQGITLSITALGTVPEGRMVRRDGARPGDALYVTGTIGDAALGLRLRQGRAGHKGEALTAEARALLLDRYLHPQPRNALANALLSHAHAAMDVSDGLIGDCAKLMRVSGCGARVDVRQVPLSEAARSMVMADPALLELALTGGDDYEILAALPPGQCPGFEAAALACAVPVTRIGTVTDAEGGLCVLRDGQALQFKTGSYSHV